MIAYFGLGFMIFQACLLGGSIPFMISQDYEWWIILPTIIVVIVSLLNVHFYAKEIVSRGAIK